MERDHLTAAAKANAFQLTAIAIAIALGLANLAVNIADYIQGPP